MEGSVPFLPSPFETEVAAGTDLVSHDWNWGWDYARSPLD